MSDDTVVPNTEKARRLTLHLIGLTSMPSGIDPLTYEMCKQAFDANRGKFETEMETVLKILNERL